MADKESDAYRALEGLAEVFAEHQDFWWRDFLGDLEPKRHKVPCKDLSNAIQNNEKGRYDEALSQARDAATAFSRQKYPCGTSGRIRRRCMR